MAASNTIRALMQRAKPLAQSLLSPALQASAPLQTRTARRALHMCRMCSAHTTQSLFADAPQTPTQSATRAHSQQLPSSDGTFVVHRPAFTARVGESDNTMRARLLYQSRKRGIKENDLLMGTFSNEFLDTLDRPQLEEYDIILNEHDNEWDMYAWMVGKKELPDYLKKLGVMHQLIEFAKNDQQEVRIDLPPLKHTIPSA